jgi:hypothetical protein
MLYVKHTELCSWQQVVFLQTVSAAEDESLEQNKKQLSNLLMQFPFGNNTVNGHVTGGVLKPQQLATPGTPRKSAGLLGKGELCSSSV